MISEKDRAALKFSDQEDWQMAFKHGWDARDQEVEDLKKNIEDFEKLAVEWKENYSKMEFQLKKRNTELEQVIEELRKDLDEMRPK